MSGGPVNQIPSEFAVKRNKFIWRVCLIFNFALAAYIFGQPGKKERGKGKSEVPAEVASIPAPAQEEQVFYPPITRPMIVRHPIPEDQQYCEIFRWRLEEKKNGKTPESRREEAY